MIAKICPLAILWLECQLDRVEARAPASIGFGAGFGVGFACLGAFNEINRDDQFVFVVF